MIAVSKEIISNIIKLYRKNPSPSQIGKQLNLHPSTIQKILKQNEI